LGRIFTGSYSLPPSLVAIRSFSDAEVIKDHVEKESEAKEPELIKYLAEVRKMERHFRGFTIEHLPRKNNGEVDKLAKKAAKGNASGGIF
jgi:ribonuclease HI